MADESELDRIMVEEVRKTKFYKTTRRTRRQIRATVRETIADNPDATPDELRDLAVAAFRRRANDRAMITATGDYCDGPVASWALIIQLIILAIRWYLNRKAGDL